MKKEEFYFDSRDNTTKIHAIRWTPEEVPVRAVVQIVHGMAEHVERYEEFAAFLCEKGFLVTAEDHLGHGKSVPEGGVQGYFCEQDPATVVVRDVHRLKKMTQELYPGIPYFIVGHSMGSFILRNYISRYGTGITGAVIMGTGDQPVAALKFMRGLAGLTGIFKGQKHPAKMVNKIAFGDYNKKYKNPRTSSDWLTKCDAIVDAYIADEDCGFIFTVNGFKTLGTLILRAKDSEYVARIPKELPLYLLAGAEDPVGDYGKGVSKTYELYREAGITDLAMKLYPNDRHEILNETDRAKVMQDIADWIERRI